MGTERSDERLPSAVPAVVAEDVLRRIFEERYESLVGLARLLLDERGAAEEVVQEAFVRVWDGWDRLRRPDDPLPYLRSTVMNLARGRLRRRVVARRKPVPAVVDGPSAEDHAVTRDDRRRVAEVLRTLPGRQRECVVLRYYLECSTAETAVTLGISEGSVKTHLHRALGAMARELEDLR